MSLPYTLRPFNPDTDFPRRIEILNAFEPIKLTIDLAKENYNTKPAGMIERDLVAVDQNGYVVAVGNTGCVPWMFDTRRFWIGVTVDPVVHHRRIGTMLYNDLYAFAAQQGVLRLETSFPDHLTESMTFAEKRGFVLNRHIFDSILDLTTFDETPYAGVIEAVRNSGIRFFTYADIDDTPENRHTFFRLQMSLMRDVPGFDYPEPPFEQWLKWTFDSSLFVTASQFMAADGENWAGFSGLAYFKDDHIMVNWMTGVQREYRGRNVALALKLQAIQYARQNGVSRIRTNNDSLNAPMLAINRKLGYKPVPGSYRMNKEPA